MSTVFVDSFSGAAADLKRGHRTDADLMLALNTDPLVSCWDLSEHKWLRDRIFDAVDAGLLTKHHSVPYPWCRFTLTDAGRELLAKSAA